MSDRNNCCCGGGHVCSSHGPPRSGYPRACADGYHSCRKAEATGEWCGEVCEALPVCPACHGLRMIPGTGPDDDVMNTPCPQCNHWHRKNINDGGNAGPGDAASRSETSLPSPFKDGDVMYMVHFQKSHTRRYDDAEEMAQDIKDWLRLHPKRKVTVELYV